MTRLFSLNLFIALRYLRAKRRNHFVSFIAFASVAGIALGVMVLVTVLSVMNGFDQQIRHKLLSITRQVTVTPIMPLPHGWQALRQRLLSFDNVAAAAPFVQGQGLLTSELGAVQAAAIIGIMPKAEASVTSHLTQQMQQGSLSALRPKQFGIILGKGLAQALGVMLGDKVVLMIPKASVTPAALIPRFKRFTVVAIVSLGDELGFDNRLAFIHLNDAQILYQMGSQISGIRLRLHNALQAPQLSQQLRQHLGENFSVSDWTKQFGSFFDAIRMEKTMMFIVVLLIIAVAAFNLVSTLVMVVNDKQAEIAILRTCGATPGRILIIFLLQGLLIGGLGTSIGLLLGLALASHVTSLVNELQQLLHTQFLNANVYFIDYLPSKIEWQDLWHIGLITMFLSLLATLYPAWRASKIQPVEALRYE